MFLGLVTQTGRSIAKSFLKRTESLQTQTHCSARSCAGDASVSQALQNFGCGLGSYLGGYLGCFAAKDLRLAPSRACSQPFDACRGMARISRQKCRCTAPLMPGLCPLASMAVKKPNLLLHLAVCRFGFKPFFKSQRLRLEPACYGQRRQGQAPLVFNRPISGHLPTVASRG